MALFRLIINIGKRVAEVIQKVISIYIHSKMVSYIIEYTYTFTLIQKVHIVDVGLFFCRSVLRSLIRIIFHTKQILHAFCMPMRNFEYMDTGKYSSTIK